MGYWLERYRMPIVALLVVIIVAGGSVLFVRRGGLGEPLVITTPIPTVAVPRPIKVYVTGAVARPGVLTLREGDRIEDALAAAGGASQEADLPAINLAAKVRDEQQVYVPKKGESPPRIAPGQPQRININTAPAELLDSLPGLGEVRSRRIVEERTQNGPFTTTEELVSRKIIPRSTYDGLKDLITAD